VGDDLATLELEEDVRNLPALMIERHVEEDLALDAVWLGCGEDLAPGRLCSPWSFSVGLPAMDIVTSVVSPLLIRISSAGSMISTMCSWWARWASQSLLTASQTKFS